MTRARDSRPSEEAALDRRSMCAVGASPDDASMPPRPARTVALLLVATAFVTGAMAWPRTATSGGEAPAAAHRTAPPPTDSPTTAVPHGLDAGLVVALDGAMAAARRAGFRLSVTSGFRTAAEQQALLADAIAEHGPTEALRWVFPPERSMHVRGLAVDVGDKRAAVWLDHHGSRFGLCRTLAWEWWHFEWRNAWQAAGTCPGPVDDPADAPS
jgi:D-alanyl-D-alanine carboxypeptidase